MLNQVKGALQREFDDFAECALGRDLICSVSAAALCIARRALKYTAFVALNRRFIDQVALTAPRERWHGWRVMAVDGSILNLPATAELYRHFGGQQQGARTLPMARLSQLLDVDSGLSWHAEVAPLALCERVLAAEHLEHAPADAVLLYDRGYPSFFLLVWHRKLARQFCMRVARGFHAGVDALLKSADAPRQICISANASARRQCREHAVDATPLTVRLVRVELPTGEVEILMTSLLEARYPDADFKALYAQRWSIEGDFRIQKSRLQMENFSGKRAHVIAQDVHAKILTKNLACWITACAQARMDAAAAASAQSQAAATPQRPAKPNTPPVQVKTKRRQRINLTDALQVCKQALIRAMLGMPGALEQILQRLPRYRHCERKGRACQRQKRSGKAAIRVPMAYKQTT